MAGITPEHNTAIVQGFGNVGSVSTYLLARQHGVKITGTSDHTAALFDPTGLPLDTIEIHLTERRVLAGFYSQAAIDLADLLVQKCDILVPVAVERVIR